MTILLADDDDKVLRALGSVLAACGYRVATASNGTEALQKMADITPDLVITDLRMPGMDGLVFLKAAHKRSPETPVVLMTADRDVDTAVAAFRAGACDYLRKPIRVEGLLACVEGVRQRALLDG